MANGGGLKEFLNFFSKHYGGIGAELTEEEVERIISEQDIEAFIRFVRALPYPIRWIVAWFIRRQGFVSDSIVISVAQAVEHYESGRLPKGVRIGIASALRGLNAGLKDITAFNQMKPDDLSDRIMEGATDEEKGNHGPFIEKIQALLPKKEEPRVVPNWQEHIAPDKRSMLYAERALFEAAKNGDLAEPKPKPEEGASDKDNEVKPGVFKQTLGWVGRRLTFVKVRKKNASPHVTIEGHAFQFDWVLSEMLRDDPKRVNSLLAPNQDRDTILKEMSSHKATQEFLSALLVELSVRKPPFRMRLLDFIDASVDSPNLKSNLKSLVVNGGIWAAVIGIPAAVILGIAFAALWASALGISLTSLLASIVTFIFAFGMFDIWSDTILVPPLKALIFATVCALIFRGLFVMVVDAVAVAQYPNYMQLWSRARRPGIVTRLFRGVNGFLPESWRADEKYVTPEEYEKVMKHASVSKARRTASIILLGAYALAGIGLFLRYASVKTPFDLVVNTLGLSVVALLIMTEFPSLHTYLRGVEWRENDAKKGSKWIERGFLASALVLVPASIVVALIWAAVIRFEGNHPEPLVVVRPDKDPDVVIVDAPVHTDEISEERKREALERARALYNKNK